MGGELTIDEMLDLVRQKAEEIETHRVYFSMRELKLRWISDKTREAVKHCIALSEVGLPIITPILVALTGRNDSGIRSQLHILGDKGVLTLTQSPSYAGQHWTLSDTFKRVYYEGLKPGAEI